MNETYKITLRQEGMISSWLFLESWRCNTAVVWVAGVWVRRGGDRCVVFITK